VPQFSVENVGSCTLFRTRWLPHPEVLTAPAGHNRFGLGLRLPRPSATSHTYSSNVVPLQGAEAEPAGPLVVPGVYLVRLTLQGASETQPLVVSLDPRVRVTSMALRTQLALALQPGTALTEATTLARDVRVEGDSLEGHIRALDAQLVGAGLPPPGGS
jgi:hypothetical protein